MALVIAGTKAPPVEAAEIIMKSLAAAWWNVAAYEQIVNELPFHPEEDEFIVDENHKNGGYWKHGKPGLYGAKYHVTGRPTGESEDSWALRKLDQERDRAYKFAAEAVKLGIDERRVRIAESQVRELFTALKSALGAANLSPEQVEVIHKELARNLRKPAELESVATS